ncbi:SDR family NAD(P)-dependent oxidoreductase, partial [Yersinia pestis]
LPPLDVLVCNAGIVTHTPAEEMTDADWDKVIAVNLTGVFRTCRGFGRRMLEAGRGSIINIGSISGQIVNVPQPQCHYNASKAGVHHLTKSLAVEWATRGVRVNAVAPTYIETPLIQGLTSQPGRVSRWLDMTPMGRLGSPHEIASVVQFLASEASSLLTGSIITADAGYTSI